MRIVIHLTDGGDHAICGSWSDMLTTDPQAVTCTKCEDQMDLQPA